MAGISLRVETGIALLDAKRAHLVDKTIKNF